MRFTLPIIDSAKSDLWRFVLLVLPVDRNNMVNPLFDIQRAFVPIVQKTVRNLFPVRRIYCLGQNYESYAKETGCVTTKAFPYFFTKPSDSIVTDIKRFDASSPVELHIRYPPMTESFQHEVELVVAIGCHKKNEQLQEFRNLAPDDVADIVLGYSVGLDMTRRDLQLLLKSSGHPLDLAKGPDDGAVISPIVPAETLMEEQPSLFRTSERSASVICSGRLLLSVNGTVRQDGCISSMILPVDDAISRLSQYIALKPGDLIYTGTPSGIGPVRRGDVLDCSVEGVGSLRVTIDK